MELQRTETASNFKELHIIIRMKHRIWHQVGQRCSAVEIGAVLGGKSDIIRSGFPQHLPKLVSLGIPHPQPPGCLQRLKEVLCIFLDLAVVMSNSVLVSRQLVLCN